MKSRTTRASAVVLAIPLASFLLPVTQSSAQVPQTSAAAARPDFKMPFPCKQRWKLTTYAGHNPDDKKLDMFREGGGTNGSTATATAPGRVHQWFNPGGLEINHGNGWFTVYLHMSARAAVGTQVGQGQWVGTVGTVGTGTPHLHYEQLYDRNGNGDGETNEMVHPVLQGKEYHLSPGGPFPVVESTNTCGGDDGKRWVDTFANAPGHSSPGGTRTGTLNAGTNYVFCRKQGPKVQVGNDYNHWWMKTDLDSGNPWRNQWVSAYYLKRWGNDEAKDNNGKDLPNC